MKRPLNMYGMPRQFISSMPSPGATSAAIAWLKARDDFAGQIADAIAAWKAGLINTRTFDKTRVRLEAAMRKANFHYETELDAPRRPSLAERHRRSRRR